MRRRATAASAIVTVNLWFDRPVIDESFVGMPGREMQWIFDKQRLLGERSSHLSLVSSGADHIAARRNKTRSSTSRCKRVQAAFPASREAVITRSIVVRGETGHVLGGPRAARPSGHGDSVPGLFLAGDGLIRDSPLRSRAPRSEWSRAADAVLEYLKH
jgi:hypothetical protein